LGISWHRVDCAYRAIILTVNFGNCVFAMSDEPFALSTVPPVLPADADYDAIYTAVMATVRGRWFLDEYARRNRNADTAQVLGAIARIESVIQAGHTQQASQGLRVELLEMARAIAQTRAEVAENRPGMAADPAAEPKEAQAVPDVVAAAERLRDIAWTMRERDIEPTTCGQIEAIAGTILSVSGLRDPGDRRAQRLREVLQYLEHHIDRMLDNQAETSNAPAAADTDATVRMPAADDDHGDHAAASEPLPAASPIENDPQAEYDRRAALDVVAMQMDSDFKTLTMVAAEAAAGAAVDADHTAAPRENNVFSQNPPAPTPAANAGGERVPSMWDAAVLTQFDKTAENNRAEDEPMDRVLEPMPTCDPAEPAKQQVAFDPPPNEEVPAEIEDQLFSVIAQFEVAECTDPALPPAADTTVVVTAMMQSQAAPAATPVANLQPLHPAVKSVPQHGVEDPLAALKSMTDEERIALFT
jgi:hypothetical protein